MCQIPDRGAPVLNDVARGDDQPSPKEKIILQNDRAVCAGAGSPEHCPAVKELNFHFVECALKRAEDHIRGGSADMAAGAAEAQVHPAVARLEAFLATERARRDGADSVEVAAVAHADPSVTP
jgi:hypothetical protein